MSLLDNSVAEDEAQLLGTMIPLPYFTMNKISCAGQSWLEPSKGTGMLQAGLHGLCIIWRYLNSNPLHQQQNRLCDSMRGQKVRLRTECLKLFPH